MHAFLKASHVANRHYRVLNSCHQRFPKVQTTSSSVFVNNDNCIESTRLLSTSYTNLRCNFKNDNTNQSLILYKSPNLNNTFIRNISLSSIKFDKEPSSKVEVTVKQLKQKSEDDKKEVDVVKPVIKKSIKQKIVDEFMHYYHGFRLLGKDIKISSILVYRVLNGKQLTRREHRLLTRTVGDMFRLVPFSVFIIIPFMEFLLPVFIKFFPGMLPTTFHTADHKETVIKQNLKVKLEMAKFLQGTLDNMAVQHKDHNSELAKEFHEWFTKVRTSGEQVSNEEIMKFSKLFEDEITLDSLTRSQLIALCRVLEVQTLGTDNFLKFQLRMKLRSLAADDKMIQKEGVQILTLAEIQQACRARGMRAYGMSEERLRRQLQQWLELSLNEKVPPSLLLLSRALMLPESIPTSDKLKATISALPEEIITQTKEAISEKEGKIDNKVRLDVLREEERKIKEERQERREERKKLEKAKEKERLDRELLLDQAPILSAESTPPLKDAAMRISIEKLEKVEKKEKIVEQLQTKDFELIETALDSIQDKKFLLEKEGIEELKEQMADYKEDVQELQDTIAAVQQKEKPAIKETKGAKRLFKSVNKMITKLDTVLHDLEKKEKQLKLEKKLTEKEQEELLRVDDIIAAINRLKDVPNDVKVDNIAKVLEKMDDDKDGAVKVEDVLKVIEFIGKENHTLSTKQVDELIELLEKEELIEVEEKIEKALLKDKEIRDNKKAAQDRAALEKSEASEKKQEAKASDVKIKGVEVPPVIPPPPTTSIDKSKSSNGTKMH